MPSVGLSPAQKKTGLNPNIAGLLTEATGKNLAPQSQTNVLIIDYMDPRTQNSYPQLQALRGRVLPL